MIFLMNSVNPAGIYYQELERYEQLTPERELELLSRLKDGDDETKEKLVLGNLKLVLKIAYSFKYDFGNFREDLIAEGNIGLMEAVDKFNTKHNTRFSTYASYWIRQKMLTFLNQKTDLIRVPTFLNIRIRKLKMLKEEFICNFGREPDDEELCEMLDIRSKSLKWTKHAMTTRTCKIHSNEEYDLTTPLFEMIQEQVDDPSEVTNRNEAYLKLMGVLERLDGVEARIIYLRFFDGCTLKETAEKMGVWIDWVRRLENKTLLKVKELFIHGEIKDPKRRIYKKLQRR